MECSLAPKLFKAVLTGLCKKAIFGDASVTYDLIVESLFSSSSKEPQDKLALVKGIEGLLVQAGRENWSLTELRTRLDTTRLSDEQKTTWIEFWRAQSEKIAARLEDSSTWTDTVKRLAWRVDVVTSSKATSGQPATEPTAILELSTGARTSATPSGRLVFEMNRAQLAGILDEVSRIEAVIDRHAGTTDEDDV